jgi:hypothetical protein
MQVEYSGSFLVVQIKVKQFFEKYLKQEIAMCHNSKNILFKTNECGHTCPAL